tara:strand:+ start:3864 stop:4166 length:303 start_codon:yes stop_codon:yes gene_type:complete
MNGPFTFAGLHDPPTYEVVIRAVLPYQQTDPTTWDFEALLHHLLDTVAQIEVDSFVLVRQKDAITAPEAVHSAVERRIQSQCHTWTPQDDTEQPDAEGEE